MLYADRRSVIRPTPLRFARVCLITEVTLVRLTMSKGDFIVFFHVVVVIQSCYCDQVERKIKIKLQKHSRITTEILYLIHTDMYDTHVLFTDWLTEYIILILEHVYEYATKSRNKTHLIATLTRNRKQLISFVS